MGVAGTTYAGFEASGGGIVEPEYNANGQLYLQISPATDGDLHRAL